MAMSTFALTTMRVELDGRSELLLVALDEGKAVGTAAVANYGKVVGTLYKVFVAREARGRGVGTAMVRRAEAEMKAAGAVALSAIVEREGPVGFWSALGYRPVHVENGRVVVSRALCESASGETGGAARGEGEGGRGNEGHDEASGENAGT